MQKILLLSFAVFATVQADETDVDVKGNAYATQPWDATVTVSNLVGTPSSQFAIRVHPEWAPQGARRFQDIVASGILNDARFFRVVPGFMAQFGIPGNPQVAAEWKAKDIPDDPIAPNVHNNRGILTFATAGPNTRTTQMFINYNNNDFLDSQGFSPFAEVLGNGMDVVDKIQNKYKEEPNQGTIQSQGNAYLQKNFPELSYVSSITSPLMNAKESL